jgi:hypothetical protein
MGQLFDFTENRIKRQASILNCYKGSDEVVKAFESDLEKAEGSKGGKVIGHTRTGKPIYENHNHPSHESFTKQEHHDAAEVNSNLTDKYADHKDQSKRERSQRATHEYNKHMNSAQKESEKESTQKHIIDKPHEAAHKLLTSQELNDDHTSRVNAEMKGKIFTTKDHQEASKKALLAMHNEGKFSKSKGGEGHKEDTKDSHEKRGFDESKGDEDVTGKDEKIKKAYETLELDIIEKGGIGSGRKIGSTRSGKDI